MIRFLVCFSHFCGKGTTFFRHMQIFYRKNLLILYFFTFKQTVKETAYQLGFPTTATFCRYFKRATGIYPQAYKESKISITLEG